MIVNLSEIRAAHQKLLAGHLREVDGILDRGIGFAQRHVAENHTFKSRSGKLIEKTDGRVTRTRGGKRLRIFNRRKYAKAIDQGASAHVIRAKRKKFLRFKGKDGRWVFKRSVNHPGNRPYKFLYRAWRATGRVTEANIQQAMDRLARRF